MSHRALAPFLAAVVLLGSGCLATHEERIHVRRPPEIVEQEERRVRPDAYEAWLRQRLDEAERLRLTPGMTREAGYVELTRLELNKILRTIPEDPFAKYEDDRIDVLHKNWADNHLPPPDPDPMILEAPVTAEPGEEPEAEGEEAEGEEAEGDEAEGDEEEFGEEEEDDDDW